MLILQCSQERKREREDIPEDNIASLQEELAASKLREAEGNLALKHVRSKVTELNTMWTHHLKVGFLVKWICILLQPKQTSLNLSPQTKFDIFCP